MYEELVKRLRNRANGTFEEKCEGCEFTEEFPPCAHCTIKAFNDAADAIEELSKPRWIPVTETMPPLGDRILITDGTGVWEGFLSSSSGFMRNAAFPIKDVYNTEITHWMPLPQPPKEET